MTTNPLHATMNKKITLQTNSNISAKSDDDNQSIELKIQTKNNNNIKIHTDFDIKYQDTQSRIVMYIQLCPADLNNLMKDANSSSMNNNNKYDDQRNLIKNCIFYKNIQTEYSKIKGNFHVTYLSYKGLTFNVYLNKKISINNPQASYPLKQDQFLFSRMKLVYNRPQPSTQIKYVTKWYQTIQQNNNQLYSWNIEASDVTKILNQQNINTSNKLLLQIIFDRKSQQNSKQYLGLVNQGNLCYMNSLLQVLYHFMPLRKIIVEQPKQKTKSIFIKYLQEIFVDLHAGQSAPSSQKLLQHFKQFNTYPREQQDIHQFMISLFDDLQRQIPQTKQLWCGKDQQTIKSKDKPYKTKYQQDFNQLQLNMMDSKGNSLQNVNQSLQQMLRQQRMDQQLDTQQFGKIIVYKSRTIQFLPPLLFMNIKRYQYVYKRKQLRKIKLLQNYPYQLNLDFLVNTPGQQLIYILYAVLVHKGRSPNSGHYFSFINLTKNINSPQNADFYQFNDSNVYKAKTQKVLEQYTGKKNKQIFLHQQYGKWVERQADSQQTAYMLTYIRKDKFQQFQNIQYQLPRWHIDRLQMKLTQQQARTKIQCRMIVLSNIYSNKKQNKQNKSQIIQQNQQQQYKPFTLDKESLIQVKLLKSTPIFQQMQKMQPFLNCQIGTIWKVNIRNRNIKHIKTNKRNYPIISLSKLCENKREQRVPDYFLIVPKDKNKVNQQNDITQGEYQQSSSLSIQQQIGLLHIQEYLADRITISNSFRIIPKKKIKQIIQEMQDIGSCKMIYQEEQLEYFMYDWNDYLFMRKE